MLPNPQEKELLEKVEKLLAKLGGTDKMALKSRGSGIQWQGIFMILLFAIVALFIFGKFSTTTSSGLEFTVPSDIDGTIFTVFKILIVGIATFGSAALFMKLSGGSLTKKDAFTVILIGIGIILLWDSVIIPIFSSPSINEITFAVGNKMGLLVP